MFRRLAMPAVVAQLVNLLYNMVDRMYIGHYDPSGLSLTGLGVCMPLLMSVSAFACLVGMGGAPRASILMGKQENETAEKTLGNCFCLLMIISAVLTLVIQLWGESLLLTFGASPETIGPAWSYLKIYSLGTIAVQISLGMNAFISAQGFTRFSMLSVLIGAVINIVLDPVFIFVFDMGVQGAAVATVIAQVCSAVWILSFLTGKKTMLRIRPANMRLIPALIMRAGSFAFCDAVHRKRPGHLLQYFPA